MKANALSGAKTAEEDPNIAAAAGTVANATVADRLAALRNSANSLTNTAGTDPSKAGPSRVRYELTPPVTSAAG